MNSKGQNKFPYTQFDRFCIRTPLFPLEYFVQLTGSPRIEDSELLKQLDNNLISEAIYLASPEFYHQLTRWKMGRVKDEKKIKRFRNTLLKYLVRMSTRCTPFGLFASVGSGTFCAKTNIKPPSNTDLQKKSHFDMQFLMALANYLKTKSEIREVLRFHSNTSIYKIGDRYRYVEYQYNNKARIYSIESVSFSKELDIILTNSKDGNTINQLVGVLEKINIDKEEAKSFVNELIENQILVSELEPSITGADYLDVLRSKLNLLGRNDIIETLDNLKFKLFHLDSELGVSIEKYLGLTSLILDIGIPLEKKYLVQTDTFNLNKGATVSFNTLKKLKQGIAFLNKISNPTINSNLENFKIAFLKRFESARIPILKALDVESGIGYSQKPISYSTAGFLDDIVYADTKGSESHNNVQFGLLQKVLSKKLGNSLLKNEFILYLTDNDFPSRTYNWNNTPDTLSVLSEIIVENGEEKILITNCSPHAARLLARFGHGDEQIGILLNDITKKEAELNPDSSLAEIIHLPEARTGNILRRPHIRNCEIPYLGKSNLPSHQQIKLQDIEVTVDKDVIKLFLKGDNRPILPRLSNAHSYSSNSLPVYHFLCDLQTQTQKGFGFNWGEVFDEFIFLPRVVYKECILSRARWNLDEKEVKSLFEEPNSLTDKIKSARKWRTKYRIPKVTQIVDGDNTLPINFENENSIQVFLDLIKNKNRFILEEFFGLREDLSQTKPLKSNNQIVFTFYKNR